jgi:hypothetical protein
MVVSDPTCLSEFSLLENTLELRQADDEAA